jgi:hypothetical protein
VHWSQAGFPQCVEEVHLGSSNKQRFARKNCYYYLGKLWRSNCRLLLRENYQSISRYIRAWKIFFTISFSYWKRFVRNTRICLGKNLKNYTNSSNIRARNTSCWLKNQWAKNWINECDIWRRHRAVDSNMRRKQCHWKS